MRAVRGSTAGDQGPNRIGGRGHYQGAPPPLGLPRDRLRRDSAEVTLYYDAAGRAALGAGREQRDGGQALRPEPTLKP